MARPTPPDDYSFIRYLAAKKGLDDRSLNRHVWEKLVRAVLEVRGPAPLRVLEVGCGIGTMLERLLDWGLLLHAAYSGIDVMPAYLEEAKARLRSYAAKKGAGLIAAESWLIFQSQSHRVSLELEAIDLFQFLAREEGKGTWDLLIAHAFLDLVDLPSTLPRLLSLPREGGLFYFTLNFDGATILKPDIDPDLDRQIIALYHRTMDERQVQGRPSGDSRTGRHLFGELKAAGAQVLAAGSSDWVVFPRRGGYLGEEAYLLHFIIDTIRRALEGHPQLDRDRLAKWVEARHDQIDAGQLVFIAHQLDFLGMVGQGGD
jgi:SAM-dependent methyltransferase